MMTREERVCVGFLDLMHAHGGRHVKRLGPAIGPMVWKISRLPGAQWWQRYMRQMGFTYRDRFFKGRYSHQSGGRLEIVEVIGRQDGRTAVTIGGLNDAMDIELQSRLDRFIRDNPTP